MSPTGSAQTGRTELRAVELAVDATAAAVVTVGGADLDENTHLVSVDGDASSIAREMRRRTASAVLSGRIFAIVDLTAATNLQSPLAWELTRAHDRLLWRGGELVVIAEQEVIEPLFDSFGLHRTPAVATLDEALRFVNVRPGGRLRAHALQDGAAPGPPGQGRAADGRPPLIAAHPTDRTAAWHFDIRGGSGGPRIARHALRRILRGRVDFGASEDAELMLSELATNSVRHGGADERSTIELRVALSPALVRVEVADPLGGFDAPSGSDDPQREFGRGLPLIDALATSWDVEGSPGGRAWFEIERWRWP